MSTRPRELRWLVLGAFLASACAAPGSEVHLAPAFSRHATAHGTTETEYAGGMVHKLEETRTGDLLTLAVRPLFGYRNTGGEDWHIDVLPPLGYARKADGEVLSLLIPVYIFRKGEKLDGTNEWRLISLPGILLRSNSERGLSVGWFPLVGKMEQFLTYEDVFFICWPLFVRVKNGERQSTHMPWPILGWTTGGNERSFRFLPFYSRTRIEGRFDRLAVMYPFFQYHRDALGGGGEEPRTMIWFWPLYGRTTQGSYRAHTFLWPLFGYASDPRSGFRAFDAFTPAIRFQTGGSGHSAVERRRIWPLFAYMKGEEQVYRSYLWPLIQMREERYVDSERDSFHVLPFWQSWDRLEYGTRRESSWRKLWPLIQVERDGSLTRGSFPSLDPFQRNFLISYYYGWTWRLWAWERDDQADLLRQRAWLNLYRRERDAGEDRRSLSLLWANRRYVDPTQGQTSETSLLLGLLRWRRTERGGFDMLSPAFPGPGWPAHRIQAAGDELSR